MKKSIIALLIATTLSASAFAKEMPRPAPQNNHNRPTSVVRVDRQAPVRQTVIVQQQAPHYKAQKAQKSHKSYSRHTTQHTHYHKRSNSDLAIGLGVLGAVGLIAVLASN